MPPVSIELRKALPENETIRLQPQQQSLSDPGFIRNISLTLELTHAEVLDEVHLAPVEGRDSQRHHHHVTHAE